MVAFGELGEPRSRGPARRVLVTTAVAALVHLGALAWLRLSSPSSGAPPAPSTSTLLAIEGIELALVSAETELRVAEPASGQPPAIALHVGPERTSIGSSDTTPEARSSVPEPTDDAPASPVMLFVPSPSTIGVATGAAINPFLGPGALSDAPPEGTAPAPRSAAPEAPSTAEAKRAVERALTQGLRQRDVEMGLGPEGPVLNALRDASYASTAPDRGHATFLAVVDANGIVVDLRLLASRGGESGWADARARAARSLAGKKLTLRGMRGAELRIEVESDVLLPSGARPTEPVRPDFSRSIIGTSPNVPGNPPSDVVESRTLATFDVADLGARPRRVVHARLVSLSAL